MTDSIIVRMLVFVQRYIGCTSIFGRYTGVCIKYIDEFVSIRSYAFKISKFYFSSSPGIRKTMPETNIVG